MNKYLLYPGCSMESSAKAYMDSLNAIMEPLDLHFEEIDDWNCCGATEYLGELYIQMGDLGRARRQLARLDDLCAYGCAQREELARWIETASE